MLTRWCQAKKKVNYVESGDDDDDSEEDTFTPEVKPRKRLLSRRMAKEDSEDEFQGGAFDGADDDVDEGIY